MKKQENISGRKLTTLDIVKIGIFAVIIAICSWISIPWTVPFTMQTYGVFLAVQILGGRKGFLAVLVYILLGAVGVPVFAGFTGGLGILLGTTGGYIVGFLIAALEMWMVETAFGKGNIARIASMIFGLFLCYTFGTIWFVVVYSRANRPVGIGTALGWCVLPFLIPDLVKIALACVTAPRILRLSAFTGEM